MIELKIKLAPKTKKIDGKLFYLFTDGSKTHCNKLAKEIRHKKRYVRVVQVAGAWAVYTRSRR